MTTQTAARLRRRSRPFCRASDGVGSRVGAAGQATGTRSTGAAGPLMAGPTRRRSRQPPWQGGSPLRFARRSAAAMSSCRRTPASLRSSGFPRAGAPAGWAAWRSASWSLRAWPAPPMAQRAWPARPPGGGTMLTLGCGPSRDTPPFGAARRLRLPWARCSLAQHRWRGSPPADCSRECTALFFGQGLVGLPTGLPGLRRDLFGFLELQPGLVALLGRHPRPFRHASLDPLLVLGRHRRVALGDLQPLGLTGRVDAAQSRFRAARVPCVTLASGCSRSGPARPPDAPMRWRPAPPDWPAARAPGRTRRGSARGPQRAPPSGRTSGGEGGACHSWAAVLRNSTKPGSL